jgi:hypothetical protein
LGLSEEQANYFVSELQEHFPDAWVSESYKHLIPAMKNNEKDRHVLAAAVKGNCEVVLTYNLKDFPEEVLQPLDLYTRHPDEFLIDLYTHKPEVVVQVLHEQGEFLNPPRSLIEVLASLEVCQCGRFSKLIKEALAL